MPINTEEVEKIASLAKLKIEAKDLQRFAAQFRQILDYFRQLEGVSTSHVEPTYHALWVEKLETPLREDAKGVSLAAEEALANAPASKDHQFRVPKVIE